MDNCFVKKPISDSIRTTDRTRRFLICLLFFDYIEIRKKHIYWYMRTNNICAYHHHPKTIKIAMDTYVMSQTFFFFFSRINPSSCSNNEREKSEIIKFVTLPIKKIFFRGARCFGEFFRLFALVPYSMFVLCQLHARPTARKKELMMIASHTLIRIQSNQNTHTHTMWKSNNFKYYCIQNGNNCLTLPIFSISFRFHSLPDIYLS